MRDAHRLGALVLVLAACGEAGGPAGTTPPMGGPTPGPAPAVSTYRAGLQTSGDIGLEDRDDRPDRVFFSAPITPRTSVVYAAEGQVPADPAARADLGHAAALTYGFLIRECAAAYPGIVVPGPGADLSPAQRAQNFDLAARCAYERYAGKPYWLPALVNDVDLCGQELGPDYHLPTAADLAALSDADLQLLGRTLTPDSGGSFFGSYYFTLLLYVRGAGGGLQLGDLRPGADPRVGPLGVAADSQQHFEHIPPVTLRCLRRTSKGG